MNRRAVLGASGSLLAVGCLRLNEEDSAAEMGRNDDGGNATADESSSDAERNSGENGDESSQEEGTEERESEEEERKTEEAETEETDRNDEPDYPSGLSEDGVNSILADIHERELDRTTYAIDLRSEYVTDSDLGVNQTARVGANEAIVDRNSHVDTDEYHEGDDVTWRMTHRGERLYGRHDFVPPSKARYVAYTRQLRAYFDLCNFSEPETVTREGETLFRTDVTGVADPKALASHNRIQTAEDVDGTLEVDPDGIVRRFFLETIYVEDDETKLAEYDLEVTDVGSTSVSRPEWVSTARSNAPVIDATVDDEMTYVTLTNESGNAIPAETHVTLFTSSDGKLGRRLGFRIPAGTSVNVWHRGDELVWDREETPSDATTLAPSDTVRLELHRGTFFRADVAEFA